MTAACVHLWTQLDFGTGVCPRIWHSDAWLGGRHPNSLACAIVVGMTCLLLADLGATTIDRPRIPPVIMTAIIGTVFSLATLRTK